MVPLLSAEFLRQRNEKRILEQNFVAATLVVPDEEMARADLRITMNSNIFWADLQDRRRRKIFTVKLRAHI